MSISRKAIPVLVALLVFTLAACGGSDEDTPKLSDAEMVELTAEALAEKSIAETAAAAALLPTSVPDEPTSTVTLIIPTSEDGDGGTSATLTPLPTIETSATLLPTPFATPTARPVGSTPCYRASFEYETIPDGSLIAKGKDFVKLWRLKNTGTCTWTGAFSIIFVQGDLLGADASNRFTDVDIPPGGFVEIEIEMTAPLKTGPYRGYWMLLSPDGTVFGVGITATEWFWVDIEVFLPDG